MSWVTLQLPLVESAKQDGCSVGPYSFVLPKSVAQAPKL